MTQIERFPVWSTDTTEVVMTPAGTNSSDAIVIPAGCTGFTITNVSGDTVYVTPDTDTDISGRGILVGASADFAIQGVPALFLNKPAVGAGVVLVVRYFD